MPEKAYAPPRIRSPSATLGAVATALVVFVVLSLVLLPRLRDSEYKPTSLVRYDAWFALYIASSLPVLDADNEDIPAYRSQRILLPALVALLAAVARPDVMGSLSAPAPYVVGAWAMLAINLTAATVGSATLALIAIRHRLHPLWGTLFGLWIGTIYALHMGMTETLAYALVLGGLLCWERRALLASAVLLGLASLAKETTLLFAVSLLISLVLSRRPGGWQFALFSLGPTVGWQVLLGLCLGVTGIQAALLPGNPGAGMLPVLGYFATPISLMWALQAIWVLGPAVASVGVGLRGLRKSLTDPASWALLLNGVFVASLPPASTNLSWWSARIGVAVIIALAWVLARTERPRLAYSVALFLLVPSLVFVVLGSDLGPMSCGGVELEQGPPTRWWLPEATPSAPTLP